jgi:predicted RNA-binding Zn ribbon-like protein
MTAARPSRTSGVVMHSADGQRWIFDPGALWLEFLLTGGPGELARFERLHRPADVSSWLAGSRLALPPGRIVTDATDLAEAHHLRDALWRLARAWTRGEGGDADDIAVVNQIAGRPCLAPRIEPDGSAGWALPVTAGQALSALARDAVTTATGPGIRRIRECAAADCGLVFVDTSRPGTRRWCSMQRCGNRDKVRALRARGGPPFVPGSAAPGTNG